MIWKEKRGEVDKKECTNKRKEYEKSLERKREEHNEKWKIEWRDQKKIDK